MSTIAQTSRNVHAEELLRLLEAAGWPKVDSKNLAAGNIRNRVLGPGRDAWLAFATHAPISQVRHVKQMLVWNPAIFEKGDG